MHVFSHALFKGRHSLEGNQIRIQIEFVFRTAFHKMPHVKFKMVAAGYASPLFVYFA